MRHGCQWDQGQGGRGQDGRKGAPSFSPGPDLAGRSLEASARHAAQRVSCGNRGITLIELMMVVVLMMIIMGLSGAAFTGMTRGTSERAAVSQLTSTLALSRQYAITHREPLYFHYGIDTNQNLASYSLRNDMGVVIAESVLPAGQWFDLSASSPNPIEFRRDGTLAIGSPSAQIYITNPAAPGVATYISINGLTGLVRVQNP